MKSIAFPVALVLTLFSASLAFSQDLETKKEKIEAMKVSFITKRLSLTPEEARAFWPIYNQYETDLDNMRNNHRKERQASREDFATISDREIEKMVDSEITFRQNELDISKKYHALFKQILPIKKVAMLYQAEEDFKRELLKQLQDKRQN